MAGGYLQPDGTLVLDTTQETEQAPVIETSPCGQAIKEQASKRVLEDTIKDTN